MNKKILLITAILTAASLLLTGILPVAVQAQEDGPEGQEKILEVDDDALTKHRGNRPDIAWNGDNNCDKFLVVYDLQTIGVDDYNIWGRYIFDNGQSVAGSPMQFTTNTATQRNPAVAFEDANDNFMVAWEDNRDGHWEIYAQLWNCLKQPVSKAIRITFAPNNIGERRNPDVICGYPDFPGCWVVWDDSRNGNLDIYGQWLSVAGARVGGNVQITNNGSAQRYPTIAYNPDGTTCAPGTFLTAWQDNRAGNNDIYVQELDNAGRCAGQPNRIIESNGANQARPDLAYGTNNDTYQIVWQDHRAGNADIYARRASGHGIGVGASFFISNPPTSQMGPAVCYDANTLNQFNTVWYDNRNGNYDIYAWLTSGLGVLGAGGAVSTLPNITTETIPAIAYSSLSDRYFVVWYDSTNGIRGRAIWP